MEIIDNQIKRKFADFSRSQCREQPKQYSYSSKCLIFDDLLNSSKHIKNKEKSTKNDNQIKIKRNDVDDVNSNNWYQDEISTNESTPIHHSEHKPKFKDIMAVMKKRIAKISQKNRRNVLSNTPKKNVSIKDLYPSQYSDAETRVHKIKQILNTIELKQSQNNLNVSLHTPANNSSEIFLIDCSKLGHSFCASNENSIYAINTKSSKLSSSSTKNAKSFSICEELVPTCSSKIKLPHIQSSQFFRN